MKFAFLQFFTTRMHGSHVMVWNVLYYINSYPVAVVKYLCIVLKHFGRSFMLLFLLSCDSAEIINMHPIQG